MKTVELQVKLPANGQCEDCLNRLRDHISLIRGVASVDQSSDGLGLRVDYDPDEANFERIYEVAQNLGIGISRRYAHESLRLGGLDCADCAQKLQSAVGRMPGVNRASVNFTSSRMSLEYEPEVVSRAAILGRISGMGYRVEDEDIPAASQEAASAGSPSGAHETSFRLSGLDCADCALGLERNLMALAGVSSARVNFTASTMKVAHSAELPTAAILGVVEASGFSGQSIDADPAARVGKTSFLRANRRALLTAVSGLFLVLGMIAQATGGLTLALVGLEAPISTLLFAVAMATGGYHIARAGVYGLVRTRTIDMNVLMTLAALGAGAIGEWLEGGTVVFLFALGNALEGYTLDRARGAIRALMALAPEKARVRRDGGELTVGIESVGVGETVIVLPGEKMPVDGIVVLGSSSVNQAPITGESVPVEKLPGDEVFAGSLNEGGFLEVKSSRPASQNTISRIIALVEQAQESRAPAQRFIDSFARVYTPVVIALAAAIVVVPPFLFAQPFQEWFYRGLVLLVIACPCALVISTPVTIVSAIARAAALGVLVKGGAHLESLGAIRVVAFDKTGTLTVGRPEVTDIVPINQTDQPGKSHSPAEILRLAAALEGRSEHPLASAVLRKIAEEKRLGRIPPSEQSLEVGAFSALSGRGVRAEIDGEDHFIGSLRLFEELSDGDTGSEWLAAARAEATRLESEGKTVLFLGRRDSDTARPEILGLIAASDELRPGARNAIGALRRAGISKVVLLTGDNEETARAIASRVGIDEYRAGLLPEDKVSAIEDLSARYGRVAMVGDGVNDAPALATASVGIAMGAAGTAVALEAADVALMADDLSKVATAVGLSREALSAIRQNITFAIVIKAIFLGATLFGGVTLWLAILADMGASLIVTLNGMRLLTYRQPNGGSKGTDESPIHRDLPEGASVERDLGHGLAR